MNNRNPVPSSLLLLTIHTTYCSYHLGLLRTLKSLARPRYDHFIQMEQKIIFPQGFWALKIVCLKVLCITLRRQTEIEFLSGGGWAGGIISLAANAACHLIASNFLHLSLPHGRNPHLLQTRSLFLVQGQARPLRSLP